MSLPSGAVDPVTLEILSHRLYGITKEMGITLERTGGTVNTTQQHDYMAALYRPDGDILSAGETFGQHVACAGFAVKRIIERFGRDEIYPDDVFLLNDPYLAAIHQSDIYTISPIHYQDRLVGWSATFVHVSDVGAMSPGGDSPRATEVFQEGLRIPGLKLVERGSLRQDVFDTITNMTRQPGMVGLDLKCEIAANNVAKSRMQAMYRQYGPELVDAVSGEMIRCSESILRKRISEIPDGSWSEIGTIEAGDSWRIHMTLRKTGDRLVFDLTGSDRQATKGINLPYHATLGM
ncbi:MAG: hydantoinase B/oxoprolinase family protein, partial [Candidatus Binatia bacterium]|nr:hydantoinase B/oxoprolinase family protein [Candidatus Binatia bacterium]